MKMSTLPLVLLLTAAAAAQTVTIFPDEYVAVAEGPFNSPNLPLANGAGRVQCIYEAVDIAIPSGHSITRLGFRQDASLTTTDPGRTVNLEIRMGYTTLTAATMTTTFASNYTSAPVTVFGPANVTLPDLRSAANPLPNGQVFVTLATPFLYAPAGQNLVVEYRCFGNSGGGGPFNYRLDRADFYSPATYGPAGCQHSGGGPANLTVEPVRPGLTYTSSLVTGPGNSPTVVALNIGAASTAPYSLTGVFAGIQPACTGQVSPVNLTTVGLTTSATGAATLTFPIPNNPLLADLLIASQALCLDLFAPGGLVVSNGAQILTGARPRTSVLAAAGAPTSLTTGTLNTNYCPVAFFEHQ